MAQPEWLYLDWQSHKKGALSRVGIVNFVTGDATLWNAGSQLVLTNGSVIKQGSAVETGRDSQMHIVLYDVGHIDIELGMQRGSRIVTMLRKRTRAYQVF